MIYTSYFANIKRVEKAGLVPVSIAQITPYWIKNIERCREVMPTSSILYEFKRSAQDFDAKDRYFLRYQKEVLSQANLKKLADEWESKGNICLMCYERPENFCHRHLLAGVLKKMGYKVEEFSNYNKKSV